MNDFFNIVKSDKIIFWTVIISLILLFLSLGMIVFLYPKLPPLIPLFNQKPWGMERLGVKEQIFLPLSFAFSIFLTNFIMSINLYPKQPLLSRIFSVTNLLISFLTLLFFIRTFQAII